jgi:hypothetical protein
MNTPHPEAAALALYIGALETAGFTPYATNNGADQDTSTPTAQEMLDEATATDEAELLFKSTDGTLWWALAVFGNSPAELIADFTTKQHPATAAFTAAIETTSEALEAAE